MNKLEQLDPTTEEGRREIDRIFNEQYGAEQPLASNSPEPALPLLLLVVAFILVAVCGYLLF